MNTVKLINKYILIISLISILMAPIVLAGKTITLNESQEKEYREQKVFKIQNETTTNTVKNSGTIELSWIDMIKERFRAWYFQIFKKE